MSALSVYSAHRLWLGAAREERREELHDLSRRLWRRGGYHGNATRWRSKRSLAMQPKQIDNIKFFSVCVSWAIDIYHITIHFHSKRINFLWPTGVSKYSATSVTYNERGRSEGSEGSSERSIESANRELLRRLMLCVSPSDNSLTNGSTREYEKIHKRNSIMSWMPYFIG